MTADLSKVDPVLIADEAEGCVGRFEFGGSCAGEVQLHTSRSGASASWRCALHQSEYEEHQQRRRESEFWADFYCASEG